MRLYLTLAPFPEVPEVLKRLKAEGLTVAILSNGTPAMLESVVASAGLSPFVDRIFSVDAVGAFKTDRRVYQYALDELGLTPNQVVVPVVERLGRLCRLGFRFSRDLGEPLRPAPRAPAREPRCRRDDAPWVDRGAGRGLISSREGSTFDRNPATT